jgi:hypothetical protein
MIPSLTLTEKLYVESQAPRCVTKRRSHGPSKGDRACAEEATVTRQPAIVAEINDFIMFITRCANFVVQSVGGDKVLGCRLASYQGYQA